MARTLREAERRKHPSSDGPRPDPNVLKGGKDTVGRVLKVVFALGLMMEIKPAPRPEIDLDDLLDNLGGPHGR